MAHGFIPRIVTLRIIGENTMTGHRGRLFMASRIVLVKTPSSAITDYFVRVEDVMEFARDVYGWHVGSG